MYVIEKHGFDNMENRNPWYSEIVGVVNIDDEEAVKEYTERMTRDAKKYKGWDKKEYPYYTYKPIAEILDLGVKI